ncbi:MAG: hypothetical protein JHC26_10865 [Thermofilum sp.]|jgi:hypothetical protein|uniref:hypothetical protein n=1 Tax=Thermofilum sp. TaxID=1961369 RepID=UPI00258715C9|nr:hypothetical protein [Thermofilum sp.]MCI4409583.1 hypothetical protein [Thermofilum sp.]
MPPVYNNKDRDINITDSTKKCNNLAFIDYLYMYIDAGLTIFPLEKNRSLEGDWRKFIWRKVSYKDVESWLERHGRFNVGLPLGGVNQVYALVIPRDSAKTWFWSLDRDAQIDMATKTLVVYNDRDVYIIFKPVESWTPPRFIAVKIGDKRFLGEGTFVYLPPSEGYCLWQEDVVVKRKKLLDAIDPERLRIW